MVQKVIEIAVDCTEDWTQRVHDYEASLSRLETIIKAIQSGYRFDDANADRYTDLLAEALATLDGQGALIRAVAEAVKSS